MEGEDERMSGSEGLKLCLGMEGSANKLGLGIVRSDGKILSNVRDTYNAKIGEGFIPADAMKHHLDNLVPLLKKVFKEAKIKPSQLDYVAYTMGPGIGSCLSITSVCARMVSAMLKIPLIPVNHCIAHIEMGRLVTGVDNPVVLYASGGNTQVLAYSSTEPGHGTYKIFGETLDIAVGNCIDRVARLLSLPSDPSPGYNIMKRAQEYRKKYSNESGGDTHPPLYDPPLPYVIKGMDVSCTGVETYVKSLVANAKKKNPNDIYKDIDIDRLCYSVEETLFAMLTEVTERAAAHIGSKDILVVGGVGCNERLQEMLSLMAKDRGGKLLGMDDRFAVDNGAMIAHTGLLMVKSGYKPFSPDELEKAIVTQRFRTDEVDVTWR